MNRTQVMLLFGGESSEHDVSISSARNVHAAIDKNKFDVTLVYIDRHGKWRLMKSIEDHETHEGAPQLAPLLGTGKFVTIPDGRPVAADVLLPILHGRNGEDGTVQGLAQLLHIPIVGCDVTASAIGMDKVAAKEIALSNGIKIVPYAVHRLGEELPDFDKLSITLGAPVFVKPARAGSSVGVSKVHNEAEFAEALANAHEHDRTVLIEQAVTARELEIAVLGTPPHHRVSGVGEIVPGAEFYSYDDKYAGDSRAEIKLPADIAEADKEQLQAMAGAIYRMLGCSGLSRVDFFMDADGTLYFNEINTLPGFTNISMYPKLWESEGISYSQLIEMLIDDALQNGTMSTVK